jgi:hypothetical protein
MTPRQETAAMWDFDQAVGFRSGSCPLWVKAEKLDLSIRCPLYPRKRTSSDATSMSALCQKQTWGNDGLLRCRSRFFDQCCHLARVRKKDCVSARKFNDLRLGPLRTESGRWSISPAWRRTISPPCPPSRSLPTMSLPKSLGESISAMPPRPTSRAHLGIG